MARPWKIRGLDIDRDAASCARTVLLSKFKEMFSYKNDVMRDGGVDAIHDMRVSARRFQTFLVLFRSFLSRKRYKYIRRVFSDLIRRLGRVRTHDVFLAMILGAKGMPREERAVMRGAVLPRQRKKRSFEYRRLVRLLRRLESDAVERTCISFLNEVGE